MAQRTQILLIDDVDESPATETVRFGLDGVNYEIDLNDSNSLKLRNALEQWVTSARRSGGRRSVRGTNGASKRDLASVRAWARQNGHDVSSRGRVPAVVQEAYDQAHN